MHSPVTGVLLVFVAFMGACGIDATGRMISQGPSGGGDGGAVTSDGQAPSSVDAGEDRDEGGLGSAVPSNVPAAMLDPGAIDANGIVAIDTGALTIDTGSGPAPPPAGMKLVHVTVGSVVAAVLSVGRLDVDSALTVTGTKPLVIVAAGDVTIGGVIHVEAKGTIPGPGGHGPSSGPGKGGDGFKDGAGASDCGGGGAGHRTPGGQGGKSGNAAGGIGGSSYASPLVGGSGGGAGALVLCENLGGAGGGALQIFSRSKVKVETPGGIHAGGGGGRLGCGGGASAGGGGSGGWILIEAPAIELRGIVAANGGGGGGGGFFDGLESNDGQNGEDGALGAQRANGGPGGGGPLYNGGKGGSLAGPPEDAPDDALNGGGGGGAAGTILLRTRGPNLDTTGAVISPAPASETTL